MTSAQRSGGRQATTFKILAMPPSVEDAKEVVSRWEYASQFREFGADNVEMRLGEVVSVLRAGFEAEMSEEEARVLVAVAAGSFGG